jgi:hypothetical protein
METHEGALTFRPPNPLCEWQIGKIRMPVVDFPANADDMAVFIVTNASEVNV